MSGARSEYINGARLDNLASCYVAMEALIEHSTDGPDGSDMDEDTEVALVACFDHEEIGSDSSQVLPPADMYSYAEAS